MSATPATEQPPGFDTGTPPPRPPWWRRNLVVIACAAGLAVGLVLAVAAMTRPNGPTPQDQAGYGSAVVPAAQIHAQVRAILPYYRADGPDDSSKLYGMEMALAAKFGNVSNADSPLKLSGAEVDFELAMEDPHLDADHPWSAEVDQAIHELAAACGIQEAAWGIGA